MELLIILLGLLVQVLIAPNTAWPKLGSLVTTPTPATVTKNIDQGETMTLY